MRRSLNRLVTLAVVVVFSCSWLTSPRLATSAEPTSSPSPAAAAPSSEILVGATFAATDSLAAVPSDAQACLEGLCWTPSSFEVEIQKPWKEGAGDFCVCFPTPRPVGHASNDTVAMEWYVARDEAGEPLLAPACVVVHESGRGMDVGRLIARSLNAHGIHTFYSGMTYLPVVLAQIHAHITAE